MHVNRFTLFNEPYLTIEYQREGAKIFLLRDCIQTYKHIMHLIEMNQQIYIIY